MALFESYERRINQIQPVMDKYGIKDFDDARKINPEDLPPTRKVA